MTTDNKKENQNKIDNEEEKSDLTKDVEDNSGKKTGVLRMLKMIFIGLAWTLFCFYAWLMCVFAGFPSDPEEFMRNEPFYARAGLFLQYAIPIVWFVAPILVILYTDKKSKK